MKKFILLMSLFSHAAFADVCGIVTLDQGEKSLSFLTKGAKLSLTYSLSSEITVKSVRMAKATEIDGVAYYNLMVNNESIDPGHTNIVINQNVSLNLGRLVGCDVESSDPNVINPTPISTLSNVRPRQRR